MDADNTNIVGTITQNSPPPSKTVVQYGVPISETTFSPVTRSANKKPPVTTETKIRFESVPVGQPSDDISDDEYLMKVTEVSFSFDILIIWLLVIYCNCMIIL